MELQTNSKNDKKLFDIDNFDIEDIPFKPINEGLGFHKNQQTNNDLHVHKKVYDNVIKKAAPEVKSVPSELSAFYNQRLDVTPRVKKEIKINEIRIEEAGYVSRLLSFVTDLLVVSLITTAIVTIMFMMTSINLKLFLIEVTTTPVMAFPIVLFVLIYNIYGLVFGFNQSVGQRIFGTKFSINGTSKLSSIVVRSQIELVSIFFLGIPYLLKFDNKILNQKVIKK